MRRIEERAGKIFLISQFLTFNGRLSWEATTRSDDDPVLWSCLLDSEEEADAYLSKLQSYALTAAKVSSIRTPGKFRVGICLDTFGERDDKQQIDLKALYLERLIMLIHFLKKQASRKDNNRMTFCYLKDSDTYLPILAIQYPGYMSELLPNSIKYGEVRQAAIIDVFHAITAKLNINENEALNLQSQFKQSIYRDRQKMVSYMMFDFAIMPTLFNLTEKIREMTVNNISRLFFTKTCVALPPDIAYLIAKYLSINDISSIIKLADAIKSEGEAESPLKRICI